MKRNPKICFTVVVFVFVLSACSLKNAGTGSTVQTEKTPQELAEIYQPDLSQIRSICELATLECYYHNVAKSIKEKGKGLTHIGEKERIFWIEYDGVARFGIDVSKVDIKIEGSRILITIPNAEFQGLSGYSSTMQDYISSDDGINKNQITAKDQTAAIAAAQKEIEQIFANDTVMLMRAQDNAKKLIQNYIEQLGQIAGVDYEIIWLYEENNNLR